MTDEMVCPVCGAADGDASAGGDTGFMCVDEGCGAKFLWPQPKAPYSVDDPASAPQLPQEALDAIEVLTNLGLIQRDG